MLFRSRPVDDRQSRTFFCNCWIGHGACADRHGAQAIGAALYERLAIDETGKVTTSTFRGYHIPTFADIPLTEVHFAKTFDRIGPLGAKSMSESPYNPVAPAMGNAIANATGIRFTSTPFKPDRLFPALKEKFGD